MTGSFDSCTFNHPWDEDVIQNTGSVTVGGTPSTSIDKYWNGEIPWMSSGDVHLKRIKDVNGRISAIGLQASNATLVDPPTVAIALAGQGKTRGTAALILTTLCTNQSVALIKGDDIRLDEVYLFYNLEFRYQELRSRSAGGGRAGLSKGILEKLPIPLPDISEQKGISFLLSTVDHAITQTEALIAKQQRIKIGMLQDLLTKGIDENGNIRSEATHPFKDSPLGHIPEEWEVENYGSACERVSVGIATSTTKSFREEGVPLLRNQNILSGSLSLNDLLFISPEFDEINKSKRLRAGDLVTMRTGYPGRTAVVRPEMSGWQTFTTLISTPKNRKYSSEFLSMMLNSFVCRKQILNLQGGGAQQNLNVGWIINMLVLRPSISEQLQIVDLLQCQEVNISSSVESLKKLSFLKMGLMQDLLTGKVRVTPLL